MLVNNGISESINSPVRTVEGRVLYYAGGGNSYTAIRHNTNLKSFTVERVGEEGKFFGFGVPTKATIKFLDKDRIYNFTSADMFRPVYADRSSGAVVQVFCYPKLYANGDEIKRDENTNEVSVVVYDKLFEASKHTIAELTLPESGYSIKGLAAIIASFLGVNSYKFVGVEADILNKVFTPGANFDNGESVRDALNAIAEATQTIYYLDKINTLVFQRLDRDGAPIYTIDKTMYFTLDSNPAKKLIAITSGNELGDNITEPAEYTPEENGCNQVVMENAFWDKSEDITIELGNAFAAVGGTTIAQFNCSWRGNPLLEIGDKIAIVAKDDKLITSYVLNDVVEYNGAFKEKTQWSYKEGTTVSHTNASNLGEALKQTFAKVDKINKEITTVVSDVASITTIKQDIDTINNSVKVLEDTVSSSNEANKEDIAKLYSEVETKMSKDDYTIEVKKVIEEEGTSKVLTSTGFKFDETGLTVSKENSEMETTITEDGMRIYKNGDEVLTADNIGVNAKNLHATTYLIIGTNSRFEDYDGNRTGCFWIGG